MSRQLVQLFGCLGLSLFLCLLAPTTVSVLLYSNSTLTNHGAPTESSVGWCASFATRYFMDCTKFAWPNPNVALLGAGVVALVGIGIGLALASKAKPVG